MPQRRATDPHDNARVDVLTMRGQQQSPGIAGGFPSLPDGGWHGQTSLNAPRSAGLAVGECLAPTAKHHVTMRYGLLGRATPMRSRNRPTLDASPAQPAQPGVYPIELPRGCVSSRAFWTACAARGVDAPVPGGRSSARRRGVHSRAGSRPPSTHRLPSRRGCRLGRGL